MNLTRRNALIALASATQAGRFASAKTPALKHFEPTWDSLTTYQCPEWFRDAKFGIWAHWGPQCVPMFGDWYARLMYMQGGKDGKYEHHLQHYGHPSKFGYKDIIPLWTAEKFDPDRLMSLYKAAGARYFVSMGVHHDNFDLWNSKHHKWNAVQMGPKRDIVGSWQKAAHQQGLKFGVSEHLGASYTWFQVAKGSDKMGSLAGVPYDGANPEWDELYHTKAAPDDTAWYSTNPEWMREWLLRITDLIDQYQPDLLYSDGALPFGEVGRSMLAHFYNTSLERNGGKLEAVYNLKDWRGHAGHGDYIEGIGVQDVERGGLAAIKPVPWQTDTAIGDWFYNASWKAKDTGTMYRSSKWVIQTLVDVVSKNGNMLLNVIQRPDGALDPEVETLVADLTAWMKVHSEAIHSTRPWDIYGEGKTQTEGGHFKEDFAFSADDIRFTQSKDGSSLYAFALGAPSNGELHIRALAKSAKGGNKIRKVDLLGGKGKLKHQQTAEALVIRLPDQGLNTSALALRITGENLHSA